jgi:hypothetical protein
VRRAATLKTLCIIELEVIGRSQCSQAGYCSNADTAEQSRRQVAQIDFCVQTGLFSVTQ